jgi:hypothetical protein
LSGVLVLCLGGTRNHGIERPEEKAILSSYSNETDLAASQKTACVISQEFSEEEAAERRLTQLSLTSISLPAHRVNFLYNLVVVQF